MAIVISLGVSGAALSYCSLAGGVLAFAFYGIEVDFPIAAVQVDTTLSAIGGGSCLSLALLAGILSRAKHIACVGGIIVLTWFWVSVAPVFHAFSVGVRETFPSGNPKISPGIEMTACLVCSLVLVASCVGEAARRFFKQQSCVS